MRGTGPLPLLLWAAAGCSGYPADPVDVAREFWSASQAGRLEQARHYLTESDAAHLAARRTARDPAITRLSLGEIATDGDRAMVQTVIVHSSGNASLEVAFETQLVREPLDWKVDLKATADNILIGVLTLSRNRIARH